MNIRAIGIALSFTLLAGCGANPKLLRHYKRADSASEYPEKLTLTGFSLEADQSPGSLPIALLSDRAQAELMKAMAGGKDSMPAASILAAISKPPSSRRPCAWADRTSIKRRLYLTTSGGMESVADRIDRSEITISIVGMENKETEYPASFISWDRFDTQYATYNLGSATFAQTDKLSIGRDSTQTRNLPAAGGADVTLFKLGAETTDQLTEAVNFAMRRISVSGSLSGKSASITQEGAPNFNLMGSVSALVNIRIERQKDPIVVYDFALGSESDPKEPTEVSVERCNASVPSTSSAVKAKVSGTYYVRKVTSGAKTIPEGDDVVTYVKKNVENIDLELVPEDSMQNNTFVIATCMPGQRPYECDRLLIDAPESTSKSGHESIRFLSLDKAAELKLWIDRMIRKHGRVSAIGGREIGIGSPGDITSLTGINRDGYMAITILAEPLMDGEANQSKLQDDSQ